MSSQPAVSISLRIRRFFVWITVGLCLLLANACILPFISENSSSDVNATTTALQATINGLANPTATATRAFTATPQPPAPTAIPPTIAPPTAAPAQPTAPPPAPTAPANLEQRITNSNVLLFEDIAGNPEVFRYVLPALERLGINASGITDTGDAQGRLLENMQRNSPSGNPWDLIIIAAEDRAGISGTFFEVLENILAQGNTSVILESWYLDKINQGAAKPILLRCGLDVYDWPGPSVQMSPVFALDQTHPVFNEVAKVQEFKVADYWQFADIGDLMYLTGTGDAKLLAGLKTGQADSDGVIAECMNSRLILQTMSSHNYMDDTMVPLWMNYVHYILRKHYGG